MFLFRYYDEKTKIDRAWYTSSSILYSECDDLEDSLKVLRVTFKNGATYQYNDVNVNDYVMFLHGGLDGSNGKALNKFIKPKCQFIRLQDKNPVEVMNEMEKYKKIKQVEDEEKAKNGEDKSDTK